MNLQTCVLATERPADSPDPGRARRPVVARRLAKLAVVVTIGAAFCEVALNPAASLSAIHFWLALFLAAATRSEEQGAACKI
jgi:hypothetical protein